MPINISCPLNQLGYGIVSLNTVKACEAIGSQPACWFIGPVDVPPEDVPLIQKAQKRTEQFNCDAPSLRIYHQFDLAQHVGRGLRCGLPIFELDKFKPIEVNHLMSQDALVVPSQWAADVIHECLPHHPPIQVAPFGVDKKIFSQAMSRPGPTRFFTCGKWEIRKGHDVLCDAFNLAFSEQDNVELILNCHNPCFADKARYLSYNAEWENFFLESMLGNKMRVSRSRLNSQKDVAELMAGVDCGVFPARAEGWNLEAAEMLAMGKQVIITDYSAHREFCTKENSLLIPFGELEPAHDGVWFNANDDCWNGEPGRWMAFGPDQMDALIQHLRDIHERKQGGDTLYNAAGYQSMSRFTWENTATTIQKFVNGSAGVRS